MNERAGGGPDITAQSADGAGEGSRGMLFAIALFKLAKALLLIALGIATLSLARDASILNTMRYWVGLFGFNPHGQLVNRAVNAALGVDPKRLHELTIGTFIYAAIFLIEGTGLILRKHWAEYLTAIVTASFIPIEVYEMVHKPSVPKAIGIAINVAVLVYLVVRLWTRRRESAKNGTRPSEQLAT